MTFQTRNPKLMLPVLAMLLLPSLAFAQKDQPVQKYAFGSVGGWTAVDNSPQMGGGFGYEGIFRSGVGIGLEVQGFGGNGYGGVIGSANAAYHFRSLTAARDLVPFGTFGYSAGAACGGSCIGLNGFNFGGGTNIWLTPKKAFRMEFRDHVLYNSGESSHKVEMRFGLSF